MQCEQQAEALRRQTARDEDEPDQGDDPSDDNGEPPAPPAAVTAPSPETRAHADALPRHRVPHDKNGVPNGKAQRNFTDPDSRIMVRNKGYREQQHLDPCISPARKLDSGQAPAQTQANTPPSPEQQTRDRMRLKLGTGQASI